MKTKSLHQIREELRPFYTYHEAITRIAYDIWEQNGRPDGEQIFGRNWKIKDLHWFDAKLIAEQILDFETDIMYDSQLTKEVN